LREKEYNQLLPFDPNKKVLDQFGWNPVSVIKPTKSSKKMWSRAYLDNVEYRRGEDIEYLAGLKLVNFMLVWQKTLFTIGQ